MPKTNIALALVGHDGNAFAILARAQKALKDSGVPNWRELWEEFQTEAKSGDYDKLLQTCMAWFDVDGEDL